MGATLALTLCRRCAITLKRALRALDNVWTSIDSCYKEIFGDSQGKGAECRAAAECTYSGSCLKQAGQAKGTCRLPLDHPAPALQRCFVDKLPKLMIPIMKRDLGVSQTAPDSEFQAAFSAATAELTCDGPTAWRYWGSWNETIMNVNPPDLQGCAPAEPHCFRTLLPPRALTPLAVHWMPGARRSARATTILGSSTSSMHPSSRNRNSARATSWAASFAVSVGDRTAAGRSARPRRARSTCTTKARATRRAAPGIP